MFQADSSWGWPLGGVKAVNQQPTEPFRHGCQDQTLSNITNKPIKFVPQRNMKEWNANAAEFVHWRNRVISVMDGEDIRIGPRLVSAVQHPDVITHQVESSDPEAFQHAAGLNIADISLQVFGFLVQLLGPGLDDVVSHVQRRGFE